MSKIREIIIIVTLAVVVTLVAEFLAGFLIYSNQHSRVTDEATVMTEYHIESSAARLKNKFDRVFDDMGELSDAELAEKYGYAGWYQAGAEAGILHFSDGKEYTPDGSVKTRIEEMDTRVFSCSVQSITNLGGGASEFCLIYTRKITDTGTYYYDIVLESEEKFLATLSENYFDAVALTVRDTASVCMTNSDNIRSSTFANIFGAEPSKITQPQELTVGGVNYFGAYRFLEYTNEKYGIIGLIDYERIDQLISTALDDTLFALILFGALFLLIIIFVSAYTTAKRQRRISRSDAGIKNYILTVSASGEIIKKSKNFSKFGSPNIFDAVINKDLELNYSAGSNIVCYLMEGGVQCIVSFMIVNKDEKANFKIIGVEITGSKSEEYKRQINSDISLKFGFKNKFNRAVSTKAGKILFGVVEITNIKILQTTFGPKVARDVNDATDDRIRKYADTAYPLDSQYKGVLVTGDKDAEFFQNDIKAFFSELNKPVLSGDMLVDVQVSGGFTLVDSFTTDKTYIYTWKCAMAALKRTMQTEGSKYFIYHDAVKKQYAKYFDYEFDIGKMLSENNFEMQYQPQYSTKENKIIAYEALFRVKEHLGLQIDIGRLIDYIQYEGQIGMIGKFTFENCMRFAKEIESKKIKLSVNVSPLQFMQVGFVSAFYEMVKRYEINPSFIDIEITETFLVGNIEEAANKIKELKKVGIGVHLDDFGKEYSSLNYLNKMPVEAVKIDRDFVVGIVQNDKNRTIVQSIIDMVHKLGIEAIAEGVETEDQFKLLKDMKCDLIQGYFIGKSMTEKKVKEILNV